MLLKFAIKDFMDEREYRNLSKQSIDAYRRTLEQFQNWCTENKIFDTSEITSSAIKNYLLYCKKERGNNPTSMNHKLHNLRVFFNHLELLNLYKQGENPAKQVGYVETDIQIDTFTDNHIKQMLTYFQRLMRRDKELYAYRDYAIILTLLGTGVRLGELINLRWRDVDMVNCVITVVGKKRQQNSIPITDKLRKALLEYKAYLDSKFESPSEYVFASLDQKQLTSNAVKHIFSRLKKIMNFKDVRLSAHTFRHTFAKHMIVAGADAFTVQKMLRHSKLEMTMRYVNLFGTALREQNDKYNPLNNLEL